MVNCDVILVGRKKDVVCLPSLVRYFAVALCLDLIFPKNWFEMNITHFSNYIIHQVKNTALCWGWRIKDNICFCKVQIIFGLKALLKCVQCTECLNYWDCKRNLQWFPMQDASVGISDVIYGFYCHCLEDDIFRTLERIKSKQPY